MQQIAQMPAANYDDIVLHLEYMKKMSDQFRDMVFEAETRFFKAHFTVAGMSSDEELEPLTHDDIFSLN